jgi:acyl carrier protein
MRRAIFLLTVWVNSSELNKGNRVGKKLEQLLAELLQIPVTQITGELAMKDLDVWDSLKHMELIAALEQQFDLQLSFDEIVAMRSVGDIKRVLSNRGAAV